MSVNILHSTAERGYTPRPPRHDSHLITCFTEYTNPLLASVAHKIHAEGYENMGFVKDSAVNNQGELEPDIDKARGPHVDYYLASNKTPESLTALVYEDAATLRKINLTPGQNVTNLPAYDLCKDVLYPHEREFLLTIDSPDQYVKEIGALARMPSAKPVAVYELLRDAYQEAYAYDEVWFFSIVSSTYDVLANSFGNSAIRQVGDLVEIADSRVAESVRLVPAVVETRYFLDQVSDAVHKATNPVAKRRLASSLVFFCEGLRDEDLSGFVRQTRDAILQRTA